jgi:hypothetical protein
MVWHWVKLPPAGCRHWGPLVQSPAITVDLRGRDAVAFVHEVKVEAVKIVGKYAPKIETLRS